MKKQVWIPDSTFFKKPSLIGRVLPTSYQIKFYGKDKQKTEVVMHTVIFDGKREDAELLGKKEIKQDGKYNSFSIVAVNNDKWIACVMDPYHEQILVEKRIEGSRSQAMDEANAMRGIEERVKSYISYKYREPIPTQKAGKLGVIKGDYK